MEYAPTLKRETRYGVPAADQILYNRHYTVGYSYYFRQAKWALEIVENDKPPIPVERFNNFRPDYRILEGFRADLVDYKNSGQDRGHLVASANQSNSEIQNSETFLLSNMVPQVPRFNRGVWKKLEQEVRDMNDWPSILETYVISGPLFYFDKEVKMIGSLDENGVTLPIPHAFFKSVLTENRRGTLDMWLFRIHNEDVDDADLSTFIVPTRKVEKIAGIHLWQNLTGTTISRKKNNAKKMWR